MASIQMTLEQFKTPDFARFKVSPAQRQQGFQPNSNAIPLTELSEKALDELCQNFRAEVFLKAKKVDPLCR